MNELETKFDLPIVEFINDYADGQLDPIERQVFMEYLQTAPDVASVAEKSRMGRLLLRNIFKVNVADDFREKLARRIEQEKRKNSKDKNMV